MPTRIPALTTLTLLLSGCATTFTGDPHIESGRSGCESKCSGQGMALAGMVFMGEYTSGCICAAPGQGARVREQLLAGAGASAGAAGAGVAMQMQRQAQQQQQQQQQQRR
jgi:hypothetical protein